MVRRCSIGQNMGLGTETSYHHPVVIPLVLRGKKDRNQREDLQPTWLAGRYTIYTWFSPFQGDFPSESEWTYRIIGDPAMSTWFCPVGNINPSLPTSQSSYNVICKWWSTGFWGAPWWNKPSSIHLSMDPRKNFTWQSNREIEWDQLERTSGFVW